MWCSDDLVLPGVQKTNQTKTTKQETHTAPFGADPNATFVSGDVTACCQSGLGWLIHLREGD